MGLTAREPQARELSETIKGKDEARRRLSSVKIVAYRSVLRYVVRDVVRMLEVKLGFAPKVTDENHIEKSPLVRFYSAIIDGTTRCWVVRHRNDFYIYRKETVKWQHPPRCSVEQDLIC